MLTANLGVLIGIIAVVFELRQTQIAMSAEASATRAQMGIDLGDFRIENDIFQIDQKVRNGEEITLDEEIRLQRIQLNMMRYFENLHYQYQIGVLDEEIWNANYYSISGFCSNPTFQYAFPNWPNDQAAGRYRASFIDLLNEGCD